MGIHSSPATYAGNDMKTLDVYVGARFIAPARAPYASRTAHTKKHQKMPLDSPRPAPSHPNFLTEYPWNVPAEPYTKCVWLCVPQHQSPSRKGTMHAFPDQGSGRILCRSAKKTLRKARMVHGFLLVTNATPMWHSHNNDVEKDL